MTFLQKQQQILLAVTVLVLTSMASFSCQDGKQPDSPEEETEPLAQPVATSIAIIRQPKDDTAIDGTAVFMEISDPVSTGSMYAIVNKSTCFVITKCDQFYTGTCSTPIAEGNTANIEIYVPEGTSNCGVVQGTSSPTVGHIGIQQCPD